VKETQLDFLEVSIRISEFEDFLRYERKLVEETIAHYTRSIREFKKFVNKDFLTVSKEDIRAFLMSLSQRGLSNAGIANYITALRAYFIWFTYINKNAGREEINFFLSKIIKTKREMKIPIDMPTIEEIMKLRKTMEAYKKAISFAPQSKIYKLTLREIAAIEILITTGMRNKELRSIKFIDVDLEDNVVVIKKGKGSFQRISLFGETARVALEEYFANNNFNADDSIFPYRHGNILNYIIRKWVRRAGINEKLHAHSFRHFYVTETLSRGGDLQIVADQVGHQNLNTTRIYTHFNIATRKKRLSPIEI